MRITSVIVQLNQNEYDLSKQLRPVTMLKNSLYLRCFLASFVNFYITIALRLFVNCSSNFWMTASRFFLLRLFESDENHVLCSYFRGKQLY